MPAFFVMLKADSLTSLIPVESKRLFIAYSGGVDSHVLLHLAAAQPELKLKITAVYVHHGLQGEADGWEKHCQSVAMALGVKFQSLTVQIVKEAARSLEEQAREARYQALEALLGTEDSLLLGQHREDQMETVLLQLFRGAGIQGLAAMPIASAFGKGMIYRPFLDVSKQDIMDYAVEQQLHWVEDPSNQQDDFNRNFLRNQVVPLLKQKWPALDKTVSRSARHCAEALQLSEFMALKLMQPLFDDQDQSLNISGLMRLDKAQQRLVLRQWFKTYQLRMPSEKVLNSIVNNVILARQSADPEVNGVAYSIRRYRDKLYCLRKRPTERVLNDLLWQQGKHSIALEDGSCLSLQETTQGLSKALWRAAEVTVRYRQGSEKIRLPGRTGRQSLKKLFQEWGIPPWQRQQIPLIYLDDQLAAVADLWCSAEFFTDNAVCYQISWINTGLIAL